METEMNSIETLRLQVLKLKQSNTNDHPELLDAMLSANPEVAEKGLRNICALISPPLFEKIEESCNLLGLTKRRFVEMALVDLMHKVEEIIEEVNPFEGLEDDNGTAVLDVPGA